jgi:hypothetical protein
MYIYIQFFYNQIYEKFRIIVNKVFEVLTMRTPPDYEKLSDDDDTAIV